MRKKELIICSYGLKPGHITVETLRELSRCGAVFSDALSEAGFLKGKFRFLFGGKDEAGITLAAKEVMAAFKKFDVVGYVTYGHPAFLCAMTDRLTGLCLAAKINFRILEGISSLGASLSAAGVKSIPCGGISLLSAATLEHERFPLNPKGHTFIFDLSCFLREETGKFLKNFADAVRAAYPAAHRAEIIVCESADCAASVRTVKIRGLEKLISSSGGRGTLHIPPVK